MTVLILEDEERTGHHLAKMLLEYDPSMRIYGPLASVRKATEWLDEHDAPDLMLVDIHLEDALVFKLFEQRTITAPVIFTTAYDAYMIEAFRVSSIDYLLKPVQYDALTSALEKYKSLQHHFSQTGYRALLDHLKAKTPAYKDRFMITAGDRIFSVESNDVSYCVVNARAVYFITHTGRRFVVPHTLDALESLLDPSQFFRVSRQCIVSRRAIQQSHLLSSSRIKVDIKPEPPEEVIVSGDRVAEYKLWLGK